MQHETPGVSMGPWRSLDEPKSTFNKNDIDFVVILGTSLHEKCGKDFILFSHRFFDGFLMVFGLIVH